MTMQAARLYGKEDLRVEAVTVPEVGAGEVLLAVKASAVCGTDIRMFRNGHKNASAAHPLVLGHEIAGVVEKVGPGVTGYREGHARRRGPQHGLRRLRPVRERQHAALRRLPGLRHQHRRRVRRAPARSRPRRCGRAT